METAEIVKVAVSAAPYSIDRPYDYIIPPELTERAVPGVRVTVPFGRGNRTSEGIVLSRGQGEKSRGLKPLLSVLDREPVLDSDGIALALWLRQRYFCTMFEAVKTVLPAGLWYQIREVWHLAEGMDRYTADGLAAGIRRAIPVLDALFAAGGTAELTDIEAVCGPGAGTVLRALQKAGIAVCETEARRKIGDRSRRMAELAVSAEEALALTEKRSSPARREAVRLLAAEGRMSAADVCYFTGISMASLRGLEKVGIVAFSEEEELRLPDLSDAEPAGPIVLNEEQEAAYRSILALTETGKPEAVLLQGVTGSGKTEVYLRLVRDILDRGRRAIVLVPEIVLTPQMMRRFAACFGEGVAMLHSALRMTERYDQWKRIRRGEVQVVLGTRSAIFAPLKDVGLIALLRRRYNRQSLPEVIVADLKEEIRAGNATLIGHRLRAELEENLRRGEQSILLLNRRGSSRYLLCGECGYVPQCPRCSTALTYHSANGRLMCHYCGHTERAGNTCPMCGGIMKHVGTGTQKVEEELRALFPEAEVLRMDADTAGGRHEKLLDRFERERIPILLGTQMVAKGLDFPNVTLVGVLAADLSLYVDNYRAAERTFSLLTQVVGRAGRGGRAGRAVLQTYTPENDVIRCAARQDYQSFYEGEIRLRRLRRFPPFADLFTLTVSGAEEGSVLRAAAAVREELRRLVQLPELAESQPEVLGPAPAPVMKLNNRYRYRCLLVGRNDKPTREAVSWLLKAFAADRANRGMNLFADCNSME